MATAGRRKSAALVEQFWAEPHRFDFLQAVRILERLARESTRGQNRLPRSVGQDGPPSREIVRFSSLPSLTFAAGEIAELARPTAPIYSAADAMPRMMVSFMGLFGPAGVLPQHYTTLIIERTHVRHRDYSLRDFLDLFNHRSISLFSRAIEKYRFPFVYERSRLEGPEADEDSFTFGLYSLVGLSTPGLREPLREKKPDPETLLYYSGHFAHFPRCATSLERLLADYLGLHVKVEQFVGQWLYLSEADQSCLPGKKYPLGLNHRLGETALCGNRVWSVQTKFRISIGPLTYPEFRRFMPTGDMLGPLCQLVRLYVGEEIDFEVQPILKARDVPQSRGTFQRSAAPRLGWNSWVRSQPKKADAGDAVFKAKK